MLDSGMHSSMSSENPDAVSSDKPGAHLNFQVVIISAIVALPQVLLVEHHTVHWLPWALHIAAQKQTESQCRPVSGEGMLLVLVTQW